MRGGARIGIAVIMLATGCATLAPAPVDLPFPDAPTLTWEECFSSPTVAAPDRACLTWEDADQLARYTDKLAAFRHAWERLRR